MKRFFKRILESLQDLFNARTQSLTASESIVLRRFLYQGKLSWSMEAKTAIYDALIHEGGYVNHKDDRGGETKYGIAKKFYPNIDIKNLTIVDAAIIYYRDYWERNRIYLYHNDIKGKLFDMVLNHGAKNTWRMLQRTCNRLGDYGIAVDGMIGPISRRTIDNAINEYGIAHFKDKLRLVRISFYTKIVDNDSRQKSFLLGWVKRGLWAG